MRNVWILVASALLAFANFVKSQETSRNLYSSRYDNLDIDTILGSSRLVNNYVDCLLSRKPCPPEGKDLKRILPEALRTKCSRCSATQKENALKIITTLYYNYPEQYQALRERWDPSGEYHRRFEEYLQGIQFNQIGSNGNDRPVRNDFDRDQSQVLLQTLILSTTTPPSSPGLTSPNAIPSVPEQRPSQQLAPSAQLTQPRPTVGVLVNRFGDDEQSTSETVESGTTAPNPITVRPTERVTARPVIRQTTSRIVTPRPTPNRFPQVESISTVEVPSRPQPVQIQVQVFAQPPQPQAPPAPPAPAQSQSGGFTTPNNVIDNFFIPPGQGGLPANPNASPFVGLFNQLGNKLATTADVIAGMLRRTVDVLVSSHLQAHTQQLQQQQRPIRSN